MKRLSHLDLVEFHQTLLQVPKIKTLSAMQIAMQLKRSLIIV